MKITVTVSAHGFEPGDAIRLQGFGGDGHYLGDYREFTIASISHDTLTLNPNAFQRAWFWIQRQARRVEAWMWKWDERFEERCDDRGQA